MYADTDFILALIKESDWLKENAESLFSLHEKEIWTSPFALQEILMIAYRERYDIQKVMNQVNLLIQIHPVQLTAEMCRKAAWLMNENKLTPFDAFHALACGDDSIISSDQKYDAAGLKRIKLEETAKK